MLNEPRFVRLSLWHSVKSNKCSVSSFCHLFCNTYNYAHFNTVERDLLLHPTHTLFQRGQRRLLFQLNFTLTHAFLIMRLTVTGSIPQICMKHKMISEFLKVFYYRSVYRPFAIINCSNYLESTLLFFPIKSQTVEKSKCSKTVRFLIYVQIVPIQIQPQPQIDRCLCEEVCCCTRKWLRWKSPICDYRAPSGGG